MKATIRTLYVKCPIVLAWVAAVAKAQHRGVDTLTVASISAVVEHLRLSNAQTALANELDAQNRERRHELFQGIIGLSQEKRQDRIRQYGEQHRNKELQLTESLGADKWKRIQQLSLQAGGLRFAFFHPDTAQQLEIADDQRSKTSEFSLGLREEFRSTRDNLEARTKRLKRWDRTLTTFLSENQRREWEKMVGEPASEQLLAKIRSEAE